MIIAVLHVSILNVHVSSVLRFQVVFPVLVGAGSSQCAPLTYEGGGDAADRVAVGADDLQRLVFGELHQQQVAPSGADPERRSALHQQGLHSGPGRRTLQGPAAVVSAETTAAVT